MGPTPGAPWDSQEHYGTHSRSSMRLTPGSPWDSPQEHYETSLRNTIELTLGVSYWVLTLVAL